MHPQNSRSCASCKAQKALNIAAAAELEAVTYGGGVALLRPAPESAPASTRAVRAVALLEELICEAVATRQEAAGQPRDAALRTYLQFSAEVELLARQLVDQLRGKARS